jgi:hypothetical protein
MFGCIAGATICTANMLSTCKASLVALKRASKFTYSVGSQALTLPLWWLQLWVWAVMIYWPMMCHAMLAVMHALLYWPMMCHAMLAVMHALLNGQPALRHASCVCPTRTAGMCRLYVAHADCTECMIHHPHAHSSLAVVGAGTQLSPVWACHAYLRYDVAFTWGSRIRFNPCLYT